MTKQWIAVALSLAVVATLAPDLSEAKRLGGGKPMGMQRQAPDRTPAQQTPPSQPATPAPGSPTAGNPATAGAAAAAPAAAAAGKRSWMGPIAGLAAGLGIAALFSHFGMGEGLANFMMLALLAVAAFFVVRLIMSRLGGGAPRTANATAGAGGSTPSWTAPQAPAAERIDPAPLQRTVAPAAGADVSVTGAPLAPIAAVTAPVVAAVATSTAPAAGPTLPEGFDLPAFERVAKMIFIRLQAANDAGDLDDLREFTTPEMFSNIRLELQERGGVAQHTDVERVDAEVIDFVQEPTRHVASVRFHGLVREESGAPAVTFDEVWHLVKPADGSRAWAIAGIQQPH